MDTPFHIDFSWWSQNDREFRIYLLNLLSKEDREQFSEIIEGETMLDWVDPETGEVIQVDGLKHVLISHTAQKEGFLDEKASLVESVFRLFLKNGNSPMSVEDIGAQLNRNPKPILKTLSGARVYRGIRPVIEK